MLSLQIRTTDEVMLNISNATISPALPLPLLYSLMAFLLFSISVVLVVNLILIVAIISAKDVPSTYRLILTNIVASSEVVIIGLAILAVYGMILTAQQHLQKYDNMCRLVYLFGASGGAARLLFMATYAVSIYVNIRYTSANFRPPQWSFKATAVAVAILWIFATGPNTVALLEDLLEINYKIGDFCAAHIMNSAGLGYSISYFIVYGLINLILGIALPMLTLKLIKRNTFSGSKEMPLVMVKFAFFLLLGNSMNLLGIYIPILFVVFVPSDSESNELKVHFDYTAIVIVVLSLIPTPVIMLVYFERIRHQFKYLICLKYTRPREESNEGRERGIEAKERGVEARERGIEARERSIEARQDGN